MFPQWETTPVHFTVEISPLLCLCVHEMKWWSVRVMVCFSVSCFISIVLSPHVFSIFYFLFSHIVCPMIFTCAPLTSYLKATISLCLCLFSCFILCVLSGFVSAVCISESLSLFQFYFLLSLSLPFWFLFIFFPLWTSLVEFLGFYLK